MIPISITIPPWSQGASAYTARVKRLVLSSFCFSLILTTAAAAQVKITIPAQQYKVGEEIPAKVENRAKFAVTFCVEFGQTSMKEGVPESTPYPFWVQRNDNGKWGTLLIGPDVGSVRGPVVLQGGESMGFPFRLNDSGRMRLRLNYWHGSFPDLDCHAKPKGIKLLTSTAFTVE
jgi:hypothetical protein